MTRSYPHGLDEDSIDDDLSVDRDLIEDMQEDLAQDPDNAMMSSEMGQSHRSVACYRYAMGEPAAAVRADLAKALDLMVRGFKLGLVTDPYDFIQMLSLAVVLNDAKALRVFGDASPEAYTNEDVEAGKVVFAVAAALSAAVRSHKSALGSALAPHLGAAPKGLIRYDKLIYLPLIECLAALEARDAARLQTALQRREKEFAQFFSRSDDKNDPESLIDMPGLAIVRLALNAGMTISDTSVYRPRDLFAN